MIKTLRVLIFFLSILMLQGCLIKVFFYRSPKPESFELYKTNKHGVQSESKIRTDGFYYFFEPSEKQDPVGTKRIRYYRFLRDGKLHITIPIRLISPNEVYLVKKESIEKNIDNHYYGYYSANSEDVDMEFLQEEREFFGKDYRYRSMGRLSKNGDTLYVANETYTNKRETKAVNRVCVFYEFPK